MRKEFLRSCLMLLILSCPLSMFSQGTIRKPDGVQAIIDSLRSNGIIFRQEPRTPEVSLSREQAIEFLRKKTSTRYWNNPDDPLRTALDQLVFEASHERFDSARAFLLKYPYDSLQIPWDKFYIWEPLRLKIPVIMTPEFPMRPGNEVMSDSVFTATSDSLQIDLFSRDETRFSTVTLKDTTIMVVIDTLDHATSDSEAFPFRYLDYPYQGDSIRVAVQSLLDYVGKRDSIVINFRGVGNSVIPVWMNSQSTSTMRRYWLKNEFSDSVTVWIGNEGRNTFGLYLEQGINFRKPMRQENYSEAKINVQKIDNSKLHKQNIVIHKRAWDYRTETSMVFSQSAMSNWVKGGENSVSTALDITGYAEYKKPEIKLSSLNFVRLKLGFLKSGDQDIRKNLDLLETNSKVNHKAFGKFDFSAIMLFKTQVAIGQAYMKNKAGDSDSGYIVSKFFNPAILTVGIGLDYKPNKETSINFSPLSYKGTFVPAGGKITKDSLISGKLDQTRHGVPLGKTSKNEPGASFMISKISKPTKNITITNRLQLFTNYINNPWNIDVDWETITVINLNWFTDLRLNTHLIFDDDTKTTVIRNREPVFLEGTKTHKKVARVQFKEMFGVALSFRF
jgi:hypothetical protein